MSERLTCPVCGRQLEKKDLISMCSDCHILVLDEEQAKSLERFKPSEKNTL